MALRPTNNVDEEFSTRNRAVTGRERLPQSYMFFRGVPMGLRPTNVDEEFSTRNRAVTGRERLPQSYMFFRGAEAKAIPQFLQSRLNELDEIRHCEFSAPRSDDDTGIDNYSQDGGVHGC
ncbi:MAG: hypothetical protein ABSH09_18080 [Bryobacteraceae bacterium]